MKLKLFTGKKAVFENLAGIATTLVSVIILLIVSALIIAEVKKNSSVTASPNATAIANTGLDVLGTITNFMPIIAIAAIGAIIIGLVFFFKAKRAD